MSGDAATRAVRAVLRAFERTEDLPDDPGEFADDEEAAAFIRHAAAVATQREAVVSVEHDLLYEVRVDVPEDMGDEDVAEHARREFRKAHGEQVDLVEELRSRLASAAQVLIDVEGLRPDPGEAAPDDHDYGRGFDEGWSRCLAHVEKLLENHVVALADIAGDLDRVGAPQPLSDRMRMLTARVETSDVEYRP